MKKREKMSHATFGPKPVSRVPSRLLPGVLICAFTSLGCDAHLEYPRRLEPSIVELKLPDQLGEPDRPVLEFNHDKHTDALQAEGCEACHNIGAEGKLAFSFKGAAAAADRDDLMNLYHEACMDCHKERSAKGQTTGPVTCGECHQERDQGESMRVAMRFDYSLHGRHSRAQSDKCERCHHILNEKTNKLEYKKGTESACRDCHGERDEGKNLSLRNASHKDCVNCHIELAKQNGKSGPQFCNGCHGRAEQQAIEKLAEIPRIERNQPERVWIHTEGGKSNLVAFDHALHEPLTSSCSDCHHQTLKACAECHTLEGSEEGQGITLEIAYHLYTSTHSCVGCHHETSQQKQCRGCHATMAPPPAERTCRICHNGPLPGKEARAAPAMPPYREPEAFPALMSMPEPSAVAETEGYAAPRTAEATLRLLPPYSNDFPENLTIGVLAKDYAPSELPHGKIVKALDADIRKSRLAKRFHDKPEVLCNGCHHRTPVGSRPPACRSCHGENAHETLDKPDLKVAYHRQCIGCHQDMGINKVGCEDCHAKASKEVAK